MKEILKSIGKRKLFNLLIFLQVLFSILYFFLTVIYMQSIINSNVTVNKELDSGASKTIHIEIQNEESDNFSNFKKELLNANIVENFTGWRNDFLTPITHTLDDRDDDFDSVVVAKNCEQLKEVNVHEGRYFTDADYNKKTADGSKSKPYSMILGSEFAKINNLKIGDTYKDINEFYCKVVGILESGSKWFSQTITDGRIMSMDNAVMIAYVDGSINPLMHYYSILNDNVSSEKAINTINSLAKKYNINLKTDLISTELDDLYNARVKQDSSWVIFSLIILVFVTIGTSILIVSHMYMRKNEIGIRMANGYSFKKILLLLWGEFFVVAILAFLSALLIAYINCSGGKVMLASTYYISQFHLSSEIVLIGIGIFLLMCLPSIFALVFKLRKLQPKDLIGGK